MHDGRVWRGEGVIKSLVNHAKESGLYLEGLEEFYTIFALHVDGRNVYMPDTVVF